MINPCFYDCDLLHKAPLYYLLEKVMLLFFLCKMSLKLSYRSLYIFLPWEKNLFFTPPECVPVNIWSRSISALSLSCFFWLWHQMNNLAIYEQRIYCISLKSHWFFLLHFLSAYNVPKTTLCLQRHTWRLQQLLCFHIRSGTPIDLDGSSVWDSSTGWTGGEIRGRLIRVHTSDKSSAE